MNTPTEPEKELTLIEDFIANAELGSDFAIFIFTYIGIIVGIMFSTSIDGFLIGEYNVGKIITGIIYSTIGFCFGIIVKRIIDHSQLELDNIFDEIVIR